MAETATFAIVLEDQTSGAAQSAASSLQTMRGAVESSADKVKGLQTALRNLSGPGAENSSQFQKLKGDLVAARAELQSTTSKFVEAGGSFQKVGADIGKAGDAARKVGDAASGASSGVSLFNTNTGLLNEQVKKTIGPMGESADRLLAMKNVLGTSGLAAAGCAAAVAAFVVVAIAAIVVVAGMVIELGKLVYAMAEYSLEVGSAAIKQQAIWESMTGSTKAAGALAGSVARISKEVPIAASEVAKLATDLAKAGKTGKDLEDALFAASMKAAGLGEKTKRGSAAARKAMLPLDVQITKFKDNVAGIFGTVKVDGFLAGLQDVLSLFDESTEAGKALRSLVKTLLQPLFDAASTVGPYVKAMFKGMVIGALLVAIGIKKLTNAVASLIPPEVTAQIKQFTGSFDGIRAAVIVGIVAVGAMVVGFVALLVTAALLAVVLGVLAVVIGVALLASLWVVMSPVVALIAAVFLLALPFIILAVVIAAAVYAIYLIGSAIVDAVASLSSLGASGVEAAGNLIDGLVNGITSGAGAVYDALKNLASNMTATIKSALGIASPSKIFEGLGAFTSEGFAIGVEAEAPMAQAAMLGMVEPPAVGEMAAAGAEAGGGGGSGRGASITIPLTIQVGSAQEGEQARAIVDQLSAAFEEALEQAGFAATVAIA
jgi:hypothetical protein